MPIRPENKSRYPDDWKTISRAVREDAGQKCEACGAPNGEMIRRGVSAEGAPIWRPVTHTAYEDGYCAVTGQEVPDTGEDTCDWRDPVRVVLTVAHLDHTPENCNRDNLRAWCQRCHNAYDAPMRRAGIAARAKDACAVSDLFSGEA